VRWRVTRGGADGEVVREARAANLYEKLPPGTYDVEARLGLASARQTVDVAADAPTALRINLDAGVLKLLARAVKGGQPLQTPIFTVTALVDGAQQTPALPLWMGRETQPEIVLPAGEYHVSAERHCPPGQTVNRGRDRPPSTRCSNRPARTLGRTRQRSRGSKASP
jgi:Ca-activated chloride channel family protein